MNINLNYSPIKQYDNSLSAFLIRLSSAISNNSTNDRYLSDTSEFRHCVIVWLLPKIKRKENKKY